MSTNSNNNTKRNLSAIFFGVIPAVLSILAGIAMNMPTVFEQKAILLIAFVIVGALSIVAQIVWKKLMFINVIVWLLLIPITLFICFTISNAYSDINAVIYALMLLASVVLVAISVGYAKFFWQDLKDGDNQ